MVSDLHLADEAPSLTRFCLDWIDRTVQEHLPSHLWILGDLFDAWVGDDHLHESNAAQQVAQALTRYAHEGLKVGLMHGNRDFLLGAGFAQACGASLLPDEWAGRLPDGTSALICHGDALCLDDTDYLQFRTLTRDPEWQASFLAQPLEQRLATARQIRSESDSAKATKPIEIMDLRISAAIERLQACQSELLIHGHTHRPGHSRLDQTFWRWVLPDWAVSDGPRGGGLLLTQSGIHSLGVSAPR